MAIRLKRWIACVAILAVLGTVAGTYIFHALKDDPPPQDDDLMFVRTKVPAAENGFRFVSQFAAKEGSEVQFTGKEDDEEDDRKHKILCLMGGEVDEKVWDLKLALEILEKEKSRLEAFDKCVESPQFQVPEVRSFSEPLRYITNCREVGDLAFLRAWAFFKQGREKEATDAALALVRFGQEMEGSQGHLEHYYRGTHMKDLGLRRLREMLPGLNLGPDQHLIMIEELRKYRPDPRALVGALMLDYECTISCLDADGNRFLDHAGFLESALIKAGYSFKPNRTKAMFAQAFRIYIGYVDKSFADMDFGSASSSAPSSRGLLSQNSVGSIIFGFENRRWLFLELCREKAALAATELLIALKCYQQKNGKLPAALADLVPEYFSALPKDPFDGKEMKYSPEEKVIYAADPASTRFKIEF